MKTFFGFLFFVLIVVSFLCALNVNPIQVVPADKIIVDIQQFTRYWNTTSAGTAFVVMAVSIGVMVLAGVLPLLLVVSMLDFFHAGSAPNTLVDFNPFTFGAGLAAILAGPLYLFYGAMWFFRSVILLFGIGVHWF